MNFDYSLSRNEKLQQIFGSIFIIQNKIQTTAERIQNELSMKQVMLLATVMRSDRELSLTDLGNILGSSRQNIKQIALILEKKGYITFKEGKRRAVYVVPTEKVNSIPADLIEKELKIIELLFSEFNDEDVSTLYGLVKN